MPYDGHVDCSRDADSMNQTFTNSSHSPPLSLPVKISRAVMGTLVLGCVGLAVLCGIQSLEWVNRPFPGFLLNQRMVVPGVGQPHWTGYQNGLKDFDRILTADGQSLASFPQLLDLVAALPTHTAVTYEVQRGEVHQTMVIPTMQFGGNDLIVLYGVFFLFGVCYLILGIVVYVMKPDTPASWAFSLACLFHAVYSFASFDVVAVHAGFLRLYFLASALLPAAAIHLSLLFPEPAKLVRKFPKVQWAPYVLAGCLLVPLQIFYPGPIFKLAYFGVFVSMVVAAAALIVSPVATYVRKSSILAQQRAKVVLWGALLAFPIPALGQLAMFTGTSLNGFAVHTNFTGLPMIIFPVAITYAIAQHNLFDVDVYIKRAVGYVVMTILVAGSYFSIQTILQTYVLRPLLGERSEQWYPVVFGLLVVFLFNPVYRGVQDLVETLFFRKPFDYKETISSVSNALTTLFKQPAILETLIETIRGQMFVDVAGVLVHSRQERQTSFFSRGEDGPPVGNKLIEIPVDDSDPLLELIRKEKKLVTKYDIAEDPRYAAVRESVGARFVAFKASLAIPLLHKNEVSGVLTVGYKKSGHFYTREDVELLSTLANQGAVALENSHLIDQMKQEEQVRSNLARYLSPQIVERVMKKDVQVNLGGDRKVVTILFSDIRNFTTISESWPPDQLVAILNEYFTAMAKIIFEHQGSLDKYIGDAIVAVFGSLIPLLDSSLAAVRAASAMMKRMKELNAQWLAQYGVSMDIGIGINTGEVFLGNVGSPDRMEFTVIGDTVNVASRLSGLATAGQILVTRETFCKLGRAVPFNELPPARVKGKAEPIDVFELALLS